MYSIIKFNDNQCTFDLLIPTYLRIQLELMERVDFDFSCSMKSKDRCQTGLLTLTLPLYPGDLLDYENLHI